MARIDESDVVAGNRAWIRFLAETGAPASDKAGVLLGRIYQAIADARQRAELRGRDERLIPLDAEDVAAIIKGRRPVKDRLLTWLVAFLDWSTRPAKRNETC